LAWSLDRLGRHLRINLDILGGNRTVRICRSVGGYCNSRFQINRYGRCCLIDLGRVGDQNDFTRAVRQLDGDRFITAFKKTPDFQSGDELNADNAVAVPSFAYMSSSFGRGNRGLKSAEDVIAETPNGFD